eukprot:CAMPEP_0174900692 /NCGR_PEP_ID=MMETSP0167-20121228/32278_1 /TAXON_ID=38298 /ORGANISM="Rhodella maculata, Strain CCMP736" /LENGTH=44 /DNA_ID= /DNA_START= /DNA_END= /DNA_ORIENTATION=
MSGEMKAASTSTSTRAWCLSALVEGQQEPWKHERVETLLWEMLD